MIVFGINAQHGNMLCLFLRGFLIVRQPFIIPYLKNTYQLTDENIEELKKKERLVTHEANIMSYSHNGNNIVVWDRTSVYICNSSLWDIVTRKLFISISKNTIYCLAFSVDSRLIAYAGENKCLYIWDTITNQQLDRLKGFNAKVMNISFSGLLV